MTAESSPLLRYWQLCGVSRTTCSMEVRPVVTLATDHFVYRSDASTTLAVFERTTERGTSHRSRSTSERVLRLVCGRKGVCVLWRYMGTSSLRRRLLLHNILHDEKEEEEQETPSARE